MKKIMVGLLAVSMMAGCGYEKTQLECLEQGKYEYEGYCVHGGDIPQEDLPGVFTDIAEEIAERDGITEDEAMMLILETINSVE
jgi:hypothetical protein